MLHYWSRRWIGLLLVLGLPILGGMFLNHVPPVAAAPARHPMGNFTINHYSALQIRGDGIAVRYVIDMAEIPAYQELGTIRPDHSTQLTPAERDGYLQSKGAELLANLTLSVDGQLRVLQRRGAQLSFPPGAGGLPTLRLDFDLFAPLPGPTTGTLAYHDNNFPDRIGWKEIIAFAGPGGALQDSTVPTTDLTQALTSYPADRLNSPPLQLETTFRFTTNGVVPSTAPSAIQPAGQKTGDWIAGRMDALTELMNQHNLPLNGWILALVIAFGLGAGHALTPGHGKTVAAAYLVGSRGTPWHALLLGVSVTVTHTLGVFALGFITMYAAQYIVPEKLYPWITFLSGIMVLVLGVGLFRGRWRGLQARGISLLPAVPFGTRSQQASIVTHATPGFILPVRQAPSPAFSGPSTHAQAADPHEHHHSEEFSISSTGDSHAHGHIHDDQHDAHSGHSHDVGTAHDHSHETPHTHRHWPWSTPHSHLPSDSTQVSIRSLIALGASGGLLPCPSALIVMLSAISFNQVGFGMVLILAFSIGLAVVLTLIGLLLLYARRLVERAPINNGLFARLPLVSALGVAGLGVIIAVQALTTTGLLR